MATIKQENKKQNKGSNETSRTKEIPDNTQRIIKIKQEKQIKSEMIAFYESIASTTDVHEQQAKQTAIGVNKQQAKQSTTGVNKQQVKQSTTDVNIQQVKQSTTDVNIQQAKQSTTGVNKQQVKQSTTDVNIQQVKQSTTDVNTQQAKQSTTGVNKQQVKQSTTDVNTQQVKQSTTDVNTQQVKQSTTGIYKQQVKESTMDVNTQQVKQSTTDINKQVQQTSELHHQSSTYQPLSDDPFSDVIFMGITRAERKPSFAFKFSIKNEKTDFFTTQENPIVIDDDNILLNPYSNASSTCMNNSNSTDPYCDDVIFMGMEMTDRKPIFPFNCTIKTESKDFFNNIIIIDDDDEEEPIIVTDDYTNKLGDNNNDDTRYTGQRQRKRKPLEPTTSDRNTGSNSLGRVTASNAEPARTSRIVKTVSSTMATEKSSSATNNLTASSDDSDVPAAKENQTSQATKGNQSSKKTKGKKRKKRRKSPSEKEKNQNDQVTTKSKNDEKHQTDEKKEALKNKGSKYPQDYNKNGDERSNVKLINQTTQTTINARGNERLKQLRRIVRIYKNGHELYMKYVNNWHYNKEFVLVYIKDKEYIRLFSKEYELHNFLQAFYDLTVAPNCYPPGWIIKLMCYYMWKVIHGVNDQQRFMRQVKFLPRIVQYRDYFMCKAVDNSYQNAWMVLQNLTNPDDFLTYISSDQNYAYLDKIFYKHTDSGINIYRKFFLDMEQRFYAQFLKETSLL